MALERILTDGSETGKTSADKINAAFDEVDVNTLKEEYDDTDVLKDADTVSPVTDTNKLITQVDLPTGVDGDYYELDGSAPITADFQGGGFKITNIADGTAATDGASKGQMDTALALKANLADPDFTGTPTAPTAAENTNNTQLATTAYADRAAGNIDVGIESITGTSPVAVTAGATPVVSMVAATSSVSGHLTSIDHALFSAKIDQDDLDIAMEIGSY